MRRWWYNLYSNYELGHGISSVGPQYSSLIGSLSAKCHNLKVRVLLSQIGNFPGRPKPFARRWRPCRVTHHPPWRPLRSPPRSQKTASCRPHRPHRVHCCLRSRPSRTCTTVSRHGARLWIFPSQERLRTSRRRSAVRCASLLCLVLHARQTNMFMC
jgi:hypothetical protein